MENNEKIRQSIFDADKAVRALYDTIMEHFHLNDLDYKVEFADRTFDFYQPSTREELEEQRSEKEELARLMIQKCVTKLIPSLGYVDPKLNNIWGLIASLQVGQSPKHMRTDTLIPESEAPVEDLGTSRDLNYDSIWVQSQNKNISDEEKLRLLLYGKQDIPSDGPG